MITDLNVKHKTRKVLEDNIEKIFGIEGLIKSCKTS